MGYGAQIQVLRKACLKAENLGISCELIDLRTLLPWDVDTVAKVITFISESKNQVYSVCIVMY